MSAVSHDKQPVKLSFATEFVNVVEDALRPGGAMAAGRGAGYPRVHYIPAEASRLPRRGAAPATEPGTLRWTHPLLSVAPAVRPKELEDQ